MTTPTVPSSGPALIDVTALPPAQALAVSSAAGDESVSTIAGLLTGWCVGPIESTVAGVQSGAAYGTATDPAANTTLLVTGGLTGIYECEVTVWVEGGAAGDDDNMKYSAGTLNGTLTVPGATAVPVTTKFRAVLAAQTIAVKSIGAASGAGVVYHAQLTYTPVLEVAALELYDGRDANGQLLAEIAVPYGASSVATLPTPGVAYRNGLYVNTISGAWQGAVWVIPLPRGA